MVCMYEKISYMWVYGLYMRENKLQVGIWFVYTRKYATCGHMVCIYEKISYRWVYGLYVRENKLQVGIWFVRTRK